MLSGTGNSRKRRRDTWGCARICRCCRVRELWGATGLKTSGLWSGGGLARPLTRGAYGAIWLGKPCSFSYSSFLKDFVCKRHVFKVRLHLCQRMCELPGKGTGAQRQRGGSR